MCTFYVERITYYVPGFTLSSMVVSDAQLFTFFSFERELRNKIAQKSSGVQNEEQVLLKSFKYFDLNNSNTLEPEEFAKAIEKIGIMIPTRQVSAPIHNHSY